MTIASFTLGDASIADVTNRAASKKAPAKRQYSALADRRIAPEPR